MKAIALALAAILWVATALTVRADEVVLHEQAILRGGLICDTVDEVAGFANLRDSGDSQEEASAAYPGCGMLNRPVPVKVFVVGTVFTAKGLRDIYRYEPLYGGPHQFGVSAPRSPRGA